MTVYIQNLNWRTAEFQLLDENGASIDLTGASGYIVWNDPAGTAYRVALTLGRAGSPGTQAADAILGWCFATFKGINAQGPWTEQAQIVLGVGAEPLYSGAMPFSVSANLKSS